MEQFSGLAEDNRWRGLGEAPAHHSGVEALLNYRSGAGFHHRLARHDGGTLCPFVKLGFDPLSLVGREQARFGMSMWKVQPYTTG
jgi:hypothetical protein